MLALKLVQLTPQLCNNSSRMAAFCGSALYMTRSSVVPSHAVGQFKCQVVARYYALPQSSTTPTTPSTSTSHASPAPSPPSQSQTSPSSSSSSDSSPPNTPNFPNRKQIEKFFFRTLGYIWDVSVFLYTWSAKNVDIYILQNATVRKYWKILITKIENARKD